MLRNKTALVEHYLSGTALMVKVLSVFLFFLAAYGKSFAKLHLSLPFPLYVSDLVLGTIFFLAGAALVRGSLTFQWNRAEKLFLGFAAGYFIWGLSRMAMSVGDAPIQEMLQPFAICYQVAWAVVPFLLPKNSYKSIFRWILAGLVFAQTLAWLAVLLFGKITADYSYPLGYPAGNEAVLSLYPLVLVFWTRLASAFGMLTFGLLWITQALFYLKRTWVFSVVFLVVPTTIWLVRGQKKVRFALVGSVLGILLALATVGWVKQRPSTLMPSPNDGAMYTQHRESIGTVAAISLFFIDKIYAQAAPVDTVKNASQLILKGDRLAETKSWSFMEFRLYHWRQAWAKFLESPIWGVGFGRKILQTNIDGKPAMVDGRWVSGPHNSFLSILSRLGTIGFFLFLGMCLVPVFYFPHREPLAFWSLSVVLATQAFFSAFNVGLENPQGGIWFWLFLGYWVRALRVGPSKVFIEHG